MKHISELTGSELVQEGQRLGQLVEERERKDVPELVDYCTKCGEPLETREFKLEDLGLDHHPAAQGGVIVIYKPCEHCKPSDLLLPLDERRAEEAQQEYQARLEAAGVAFMELGFQNFDTNWPRDGRHCQFLDDAVNKLTTWAESPSRTAWLAGPYGCGKTHLAVATLRLYLKKPRRTVEHELGMPTFIYGTGFHFACLEGWEAIKASWSDFGAMRYRQGDIKQGELVRKIQEARLLVLDDLDKVAPSDGWFGWLLPIVNYRVERKLATLVTTNRPVSEMRSYAFTSGKPVTWGDKALALFDRLQGDVVVRLEFPQIGSYRRKDG